MSFFGFLMVFSSLISDIQNGTLRNFNASTPSVLGILPESSWSTSPKSSNASTNASKSSQKEK